MFSAVAKRSSGAVLPKLRVSRLACSFSTTRCALRLTRQPSALMRPKLRSVAGTSLRTYATSANDAPSDQSQENQTPTEDAGIPPDAWVSILENTISAPWLAVRPSTPERILERAFTLILQILLSLNMPRDPEAAQAFFFAFENAPVSPDSEIGRGRRAIATLARIVIDDISSIPQSSPLRSAHPKIFALHGALSPLADLHLRNADGDVAEWKEFWTRAEAPLFELNGELHTSGFGMDLEELLKAKEEEEAAKKQQQQ